MLLATTLAIIGTVQSACNPTCYSGCVMALNPRDSAYYSNALACASKCGCAAFNSYASLLSKEVGCFDNTLG